MAVQTKVLLQCMFAIKKKIIYNEHKTYHIVYMDYTKIV